MSGQIPKQRKTTLDAKGNITVDQFYFSFDDWSCIVPRTIDMMMMAVSKLANGFWWEQIIDLAANSQVTVNENTGDLHIIVDVAQKPL